MSAFSRLFELGLDFCLPNNLFHLPWAVYCKLRERHKCGEKRNWSFYRQSPREPHEMYVNSFSRVMLKINFAASWSVNTDDWMVLREDGCVREFIDGISHWERRQHDKRRQRRFSTSLLREGVTRAFNRAVSRRCFTQLFSIINRGRLGAWLQRERWQRKRAFNAFHSEIARGIFSVRGETSMTQTQILFYTNLSYL